MDKRIEKHVQSEVIQALSCLPQSLVWRQASGTYMLPGQKNAGRITVGKVGMADVAAIIAGHSYQIEVKWKHRQTKPQREWAVLVERAGGTYAVVRSWEQAVKVVLGDSEEAALWIDTIRKRLPLLSQG